MADYQEMYLSLFRAVTAALDALDDCNYGEARALLVLAQQSAEETYIETAEKESA